MNFTKTVFLLTITLLVIPGFAVAQSNTAGQELLVIDQNYDQALAAAAENDKLLFVDFYTTWCGPCKQLDRLVYQNDSMRAILHKDVVLLKYDAEKDSTFHLSKKHHVLSYPTGLILDQNGLVVNRIYSFAGEDAAALSNSVVKFVDESTELSKNKKTVAGYSGDIDPTIYPDFYADYVNRTDTKVDPMEVNTYLESLDDIYAENYFSVLLYFAGKVNNSIADRTLEHKDKYIALYGETDLGMLLSFLTSGRFNRAIEQDNQAEFDQAIAFSKKALGEERTAEQLPSFERSYLEAQNKWAEVFELYKKMKDDDEMENGYINYFSWQVFKRCDDQEVIRKCLAWMKVVTDEEPEFDYLDTYAYLLYKSGDKAETKRVAQLAIEAGKLEDRITTGLEKLLTKL